MSAFIPPPAPGERRAPPLKIWWIVWAGLLTGLCALWWQFGFLKFTGNAPHANPFVDLVGLVPLFVSIVVRWLVLPRYSDAAKAFPMFVVGLALAEGCGLLGIFMGGPYRDDLFLLGALGIIQFAPFYAKRFGEPKVPGFIPNN